MITKGRLSLPEGGRWIGGWQRPRARLYQLPIMLFFKSFHQRQARTAALVSVSTLSWSVVGYLSLSRPVVTWVRARARFVSFFPLWNNLALDITQHEFEHARMPTFIINVLSPVCRLHVIVCRHVGVFLRVLRFAPLPFLDVRVGPFTCTFKNPPSCKYRSVKCKMYFHAVNVNSRAIMICTLTGAHR